MKSLPLAFIDTETTGTNPKLDRVIEIGIIRVENGKIVSTLDTVINPRTRVPEEIYFLTGIGHEEISRAPDFEIMKHELREILDGAIFTAHNARFDYAFLKHEFGRFGDNFQSKVLCTVKLTRKLYPQISRYNLETIIKYFGLHPKARHRAYADAEVLWDLYQIAVQNHGHELVSEVINLILKTSSHPSHLESRIIDSLPESPGVYIFFGSDLQLPLYVGKSVSIKDRVKGHFSGDYQNSSDLAMSSQIRKIEIIKTAGEIGALIRESSNIKAMTPVYNKQLRKRGSLVGSLVVKEGQYNSLMLNNLEEVENLEEILVVFRSKKNATENLHNLCREYNLCPRLLGLENSKGRCFATQIGVCFGACVGEEGHEVYNRRFNEAFFKTRVLKWPYETVIVLKEEDASGLTELHFIDKWIYLGSVVFSKLSDDEPKVEKYTPKFDWDIYKILSKAMLNGKNIHPMTKEEKAMFFEENAL